MFENTTFLFYHKSLQSLFKKFKYFSLVTCKTPETCKIQIPSYVGFYITKLILIHDTENLHKSGIPDFKIEKCIMETIIKENLNETCNKP